MRIAKRWTTNTWAGGSSIIFCAATLFLAAGASPRLHAQAPQPEVIPASSHSARLLQAETLFVYGPGGPLPAMKEAASAFARRNNIRIEVTGGPTPEWLTQARLDADVIFSGAENMMTDFVRQLGDTTGGSAPHPGRIDEATIVPLYLRPVAMLVRPGNPKRIARFEDLLRPGIKVLVVQGAGQTGLWEDVAGRTGDIEVVRAFRRNIGAVAQNSGEAEQRWTSDRSFDAWLIWNIWQVANPALAQSVPVAERWRIYRDAGVALTVKGRERHAARDFVRFLESPEGARIFAKWGWMTRTPAATTQRRSPYCNDQLRTVEPSLRFWHCGLPLLVLPGPVDGDAGKATSQADERASPDPFHPRATP